MANNYPPVGFYFNVSIEGETESGSFQEVSGISMEMDTDTLEGGENRFVHKVPGKVTYDNLILKRGLLSDSNFKTWVIDTLTSGMSKPINPKTVLVQLLNSTDDQNKPLMTWTFHNAYPVKWSASSIEKNSNKMVIESLELAYNYFEQKS